MQLLGGLSPDTFLRDYWQKKPLFVKGALPDFTPPVSPDDLKRLATREDAAARLILEEGGEYPWELRHGPFRLRDFQRLPETKWTFLVQEVDRFSEAARALLDRFSFIPRWRVDDLMISYAAPDGGVGAHIDNYDVFLIQGLGTRRWRIGGRPLAPEDERLVEDLDVSVLADFEWTEEFLCEPGDLLYLPPRFAHEGLALSACMTLSVGFRAPSHADIVSGFLEHALQRFPDDAFYADPDLAPATHPGAIDEAALAQVRSVLARALDDETAFREWFGTFMTESKRFDLDVAGESVTEDDVAEAVRGGAGVRHTLGVRLAYVDLPDGARTLFAGGQAFRLEPDLAFSAPLLTDRLSVPAADLAPYVDAPDFCQLLATLVAEGFLTLEDG